MAKVPPLFTLSLSQQQHVSLSPMEASLEAMLVGREANGADIFMPVGCKVSCFQWRIWWGKVGAMWHHGHVPSMSSWTISAHY